jgi:hypothetical protein
LETVVSQLAGMALRTGTAVGHDASLIRIGSQRSCSPELRGWRQTMSRGRLYDMPTGWHRADDMAPGRLTIIPGRNRATIVLLKSPFVLLRCDRQPGRSDRRSVPDAALAAWRFAHKIQAATKLLPVWLNLGSPPFYPLNNDALSSSGWNRQASERAYRGGLVRQKIIRDCETVGSALPQTV